jgi:hypothetical protein
MSNILQNVEHSTKCRTNWAVHMSLGAYWG